MVEEADGDDMEVVTVEVAVGGKCEAEYVSMGSAWIARPVHGDLTRGS